MVGSNNSEALWQRAQQAMPGGVNSPVRAHGRVGGTPLFVRSGSGATIEDADGRRLVDFVGSYGPLIAGHAPPAIVEAIVEAAAAGTSFGACTERELRLAEQVVAHVPSVQQVRMVNSGTEATMSAVRLARGATGRAKLIKFSGCYHGHADLFLADAGSGLASFDVPASAGVPAQAVADVVTLAYNDLAATEATMERLSGQVAAIIVEPVACNMGLVLPRPEFLPGLRRLCDRHGSLLIFDEVITGFRLGLGGAQVTVGVAPDLTCFGKIIGGGLPVGAYGGAADVMAQLSPAGSVYQAGTLSGNPLAMAAGHAMLTLLEQPHFYAKLEAKAQRLAERMAAVLAAAGGPATFVRIGSIFYLWPVPGAAAPPANFAQVQGADRAAYARWFHHLRAAGIAVAPSPYEVAFLSAAHDDGHLDQLASACAEAWSCSPRASLSR